MITYSALEIHQQRLLVLKAPTDVLVSLEMFIHLPEGVKVHGSQVFIEGSEFTYEYRVTGWDKQHDALRLKKVGEIPQESPIQRLKKSNIGWIVDLYGNYHDKKIWDEVVNAKQEGVEAPDQTD